MLMVTFVERKLSLDAGEVVLADGSRGSEDLFQRPTTLKVSKYGKEINDNNLHIQNHKLTQPRP